MMIACSSPCRCRGWPSWPLCRTVISTFPCHNCHTIHFLLGHGVDFLTTACEHVLLLLCVMWCGDMTKYSTASSKQSKTKQRAYRSTDVASTVTTSKLQRAHSLALGSWICSSDNSAPSHVRE